MNTCSALASFFKIRADLIKLEMPSVRPGESSAAPLEISLMEEKILEALLRVPGSGAGDPRIFQRRAAGHAARPQHHPPVVRLPCPAQRIPLWRGQPEAEPPRRRPGSTTCSPRKRRPARTAPEIEKDIVTGISNFQRKLALNKTRLLNQEIAVAERDKNSDKVKQLDEAEGRLGQEPGRTFAGGTD